MKIEYIRYGHNTHKLKEQLSTKEKKVLDDYAIHLSTTANPDKINQNLTILYQVRDVLQKELIKVNRKDLEALWGLIKLSQHEYNSKVMIKRAVKRFCKWYYKSIEMLEGLEAGDFKANRKKVNKSVLIKPEELQRMLHRATNLRDKALLILLYESASRPQELRDLRWKDIDWDKEEVHLDSSKTERARDVPIKESIVHLKRWKQEWAYPEVKEQDFIFPSRWREEQLTTEHVNNIVKKIAVLAGITREITSYTFRHSRLTEIYVAGVQGLSHNKFAGHKFGSKQTATYAHLDNEDMTTEVLTKVYHKKELSPEKKKELEDEIKQLKKRLDDYDNFETRMEQKIKEIQNKVSLELPTTKQRIEELKGHHKPISK